MPHIFSLFQLLQRDPTRRFEVSSIKLHPWIVQHCGPYKEGKENVSLPSHSVTSKSKPNTSDQTEVKQASDNTNTKPDSGSKMAG